MRSWFSKRSYFYCVLSTFDLFLDDDDDDNPDVEADEAATEARSRPTVHTPGPWFDRILGACNSSAPLSFIYE